MKKPLFNSAATVLFTGAAVCAVSIVFTRQALRAPDAAANLALVARASASYCSGHETIAALNDGFEPANSDDKSHGAYGNWPRPARSGSQYEWSQPISTRQDRRVLVRRPPRRASAQGLPAAVLGWQGTSCPSPRPTGLGLAEQPVQHHDLCRSDHHRSCGWSWTPTASPRRASWNGESTTRASRRTSRRRSRPASDRVVVLPGKTYLSGTVKDDGKPEPARRPSPGARRPVPARSRFANADAADTTARFSAAGDYVLKLTADDGQTERLGHAARHGGAAAARRASRARRDRRPTRSPARFWSARRKSLIVNWIPHCYAQDSTTRASREGGIENFVEAGNKLAGQPARAPRGPVFANAWVYNTVESMCIALMVDPQGDAEIVAAQKAMLRKRSRTGSPRSSAPRSPTATCRPCYTLHGHQALVATSTITRATRPATSSRRPSPTT